MRATRHAVCLGLTWYFGARASTCRALVLPIRALGHIGLGPTRIPGVVHPWVGQILLRLYSWVWFEPTKGTPLPPLRGSRPFFFALPVLSVPLVPVHRLCLGRGDQIVPRKCALKGGHRTPNPLSILAELTWNAQIWRIAERLVCHDTLFGAVRRGGYVAFAPANARFLFLATIRIWVWKDRFSTYTFDLPRI